MGERKAKIQVVGVDNQVYTTVYKPYTMQRLKWAKTQIEAAAAAAIRWGLKQPTFMLEFDGQTFSLALCLLYLADLLELTLEISLV